MFRIDGEVPCDGRVILTHHTGLLGQNSRGKVNGRNSGGQLLLASSLAFGPTPEGLLGVEVATPREKVFCKG